MLCFVNLVAILAMSRTVLLVHSQVSQVFDLEVDDECEMDRDPHVGVCKLISDCPQAIKALQKSQAHNLKRCGFSGFFEIVCCPKADSRQHFDRTTPTPRPHRWTTRNPERSPQRKSQTACDSFANEVAPKLSYQILGGEKAALGDFPHMAAIGYPDNDIEGNILWRCGGSLINDRYILTAAHCIGRDPPVRVRLGTVDLRVSGDTEEIEIDGVETHSGYTRRNRQDDIALLRLKRRIKYSDNIYPACLYDSSNDPREPLIATGWGATSATGEQTSPVLLQVKLDIIPLEECNSTYIRRVNKNISKLQICAGSKDGKKDACQGDSGGPLQFQPKNTSNIYSIVGVTSYGIGCGGTSPSVYTRVANYLDWIENIVWP